MRNKYFQQRMPTICCSLYTVHPFTLLYRWLSGKITAITAIDDRGLASNPIDAPLFAGKYGRIVEGPKENRAAHQAIAKVLLAAAIKLSKPQLMFLSPRDSLAYLPTQPAEWPNLTNNNALKIYISGMTSDLSRRSYCLYKP